MKPECVECGRPEATETSDLCHKCEVRLAAEEDRDGDPELLSDIEWYERSWVSG